jgi:hypothetical protein
MRIEITSTQAGAPRTRALRTTVQPAASWAGPPLAASSLHVDPSRVDPSKGGPFSVDPAKSGPFSPGCATPVPVRWDVVRG